MVTKLVGRYDSVSDVVARWVLAYDMHVLIAQSELHLWGSCPVTNCRHCLVHCWRIYAEELERLKMGQSENTLGKSFKVAGSFQ